MSAWRGGSGLVSITVAALRQAQLVMGLLTIYGWSNISVCDHLHRSTHPSIPPRYFGISGPIRQEYSAFMKFWLTSGKMLNIEQVEQYTKIFANEDHILDWEHALFVTNFHTVDHANGQHKHVTMGVAWFYVAARSFRPTEIWLIDLIACYCRMGSCSAGCDKRTTDV